MSILKTILGNTSFYKAMQQRKHDAFRKQQEQQELALLPERKVFYNQFISPNNLVFDVGANAGNRVQIFLELQAKVIAVEPQPACVDTLVAKFGDRITIEQVGVNSEAGELEMHIANDSTISSFSKEFISNTSKGRFSHYSWDKKIIVTVTTLDALIAKHGVPQFCKIDVEGFELNVLKGLTHKIPFLSFEYCVPEMMENMLQCMQCLHQLSPTGTFNYSIAESMELALKDWVSYEEIIAITQTPNFINTLFGDVYFRS